MGKIFHVNVANKIAIYQKRDGDLVCGNSDYQMQFAFDSEWDSHETKTARFIWGNKYFDVEFTGDTCDIPMIKNTTKVKVGVYAGDLSTTSPAEITCVKSILCGSEQPNPGTGQHYSNEAKEAAVEAKASEMAAKTSEDNAKASETDAENAANTATEQAEMASYHATESANSASEAKTSENICRNIAADSVNMDARISRNSKLISNILEGTIPSPFVTDSTVAYVKDVPENALPYAEVNKIGGMTRKCTNLIPFPYTSGGAGYVSESNGVKISVLNDGGIAFSGTPTGYVGFVVYNGAVLSKGEQVISLQGTFGGIYAILYLYDSNNSEIAQFSLLATNNSIKLNMDSYPSAASMNLTISRSSTGTNMSGTVYPMLNPGTTAQPYEPYFEGLRSAPVTSVESVGINIWDEQWESGYINYDTGALVASSTNIRTKNYIPVQPNTTYYKLSPYVLITLYYDKSYNVVGRSWTNSNQSFTTLNNAYYMKFCFGAYSESGTVTEYKHDICINRSNEAINGKYYPYTKSPLPIPEEVQALDGYGDGIGATVNNYITLNPEGNVKTYTKTVGVVDFGTLTWLTQKAGLFYANVPNILAKYTSIGVLCGTYDYRGFGEIATMTTDKSCWNNAGYIWVRDTAYTDAASFKAAMAGVMLYYQLATPEVTDISALITADNLIPVQGNGTITFVNEYGYAVPSTVEYMTTT